MSTTLKVAVLMGSPNDGDLMQGASDMLERFGVEADVRVMSAHRTPAVVAAFAQSARAEGYAAIICGAGMAAHLAGAVAAHTTLPVVGVPLASGALNGIDALYSTVQMPKGIPVATVAIDGSMNAALLVVEMLAITDTDLQAQFDLAVRIRDKVSEANQAVIDIRRIKQQVSDRLTKSQDAQLKQAADQLTRNLSAVEEEIYQVRNQSGQDPLNFPIKTNNRLASLLRVAVSGEGRPTGNVEPIFKELIVELQAETDRLQKVLADQLPPFNNMLQRNKKAPISEK